MWTLDELGARVAAALEGCDGPASGRVRAVPDARTIRYYATLGLVDRPAGWRGRTALYGPRHLRQLVAIKRLQARGCSLAQVQAELAGATERVLARLSDVPAQLLGEAASTPASAAPARARTAFWRAPTGDARVAPEGSHDVHVSLELARGVRVLLPGGRIPDEHEIAALRRAAQPLLRAIRACGLDDRQGRDER